MRESDWKDSLDDVRCRRRRNGAGGMQHPEQGGQPPDGVDEPRVQQHRPRGQHRYPTVQLLGSRQRLPRLPLV